MKTNVSIVPASERNQHLMKSVGHSVMLHIRPWDRNTKFLIHYKGKYDEVADSYRGRIYASPCHPSVRMLALLEGHHTYVITTRHRSHLNQIWVRAMRLTTSQVYLTFMPHLPWYSLVRLWCVGGALWVRISIVYISDKTIMIWYCRT